MKVIVDGDAVFIAADDFVDLQESDVVWVDVPVEKLREFQRRERSRSPRLPLGEWAQETLRAGLEAREHLRKHELNYVVQTALTNRLIDVAYVLLEEERTRMLMVEALSAYRSALRSGEPESETLREQGHRAFEASHRLTTAIPPRENVAKKSADDVNAKAEDRR